MFTSVWVTVLSPRWPAPGTCHRRLPDYLPIKPRWTSAPHLFSGFREQVFPKWSQPSPCSVSDSLFPHTRIKSLQREAAAFVFQHARRMLTVNPRHFTVCLSFANELLSRSTFGYRLRPHARIRLSCPQMWCLAGYSWGATLTRKKVKARIEASANQLLRKVKCVKVTYVPRRLEYKLRGKRDEWSGNFQLTLIFGLSNNMHDL